MGAVFFGLFNVSSAKMVSPIVFVSFIFVICANIYIYFYSVGVITGFVSCYCVFFFIYTWFRRYYVLKTTENFNIKNSNFYIYNKKAQEDANKVYLLLQIQNFRLTLKKYIFENKNLYYKNVFVLNNFFLDIENLANLKFYEIDSDFVGNKLLNLKENLNSNFIYFFDLQIDNLIKVFVKDTEDKKIF